jgi:hypothetical protein
MKFNPCCTYFHNRSIDGDSRSTFHFVGNDGEGQG